MNEASGPKAHDWRPNRFMVIAAHPDDADFGPAATASKWIDAGSAGWLVCCTSGDQGGEDPDLDPMQLALTREEEQRRASEIVGYAGITFLHQPDGALANDLPLREQLVREIRTFRPDAVLTHDPDVTAYGRGGINHTDHRAAGIAAIDAVYPAARNPMAFPKLARNGLAPHRVRRIYLFWPNQADTWIDVSTTLDRKIRALREHPSQLKHPEELDERILRSAAETGSAIGAEAADAFRLVVIEEEEEEGPTEEGLETARLESAE
jgi:LmbE family N-acetylglucosaminyl deacetylase